MNNSTTSVVDSEVSKYAVLVLMCVINATAVIGNVSIIVVVLRCFHLRHTLTNFFVLNLSVVDFLASVVTLPMGISSFLDDTWPYGPNWCIASGFLTSFVIFASICSLCIISMERYYSIKLPMHHAANMTLQKTVTAIVFVWVQSTILAILPVLGVNSYSYQEHKKHCSFTWQGSSEDVVYVLFISGWSFLIPAVILLIMHCGIFRVAREAAQQIRPYPSTPTVSILVVDHRSDDQTAETTSRLPVTCRKAMCWCAPGDDTGVHVVERSMSAHLFQHTPRSNKGHLKAIKTLIIIFSSFLLLWGPFFILHVHGAISGHIVHRETTELLTTWLGYTSFAVNPLLYGWMNRAIRQELVLFYQNNVCFCFYAPNSQHGHSDGPREHEDFIQFLERTSYKAKSPIQNQRTTDANEQPHRENIHTVNKEQANRENIQIVNKEQANRENIHTVNKEQANRENIQIVNKEKANRENIHTVNKEQANHENIHTVNKEQANRENIHTVNKEQANRENIHTVNKEQANRENIHTVNKEQAHKLEHVLTVNKETQTEHAHSVRKQRKHHELVHTVNNEHKNHNHGTVINSERIHRETVIINSEQKDHARFISLNNNQIPDKPATPENNDTDREPSVYDTTNEM